MENLALKEMVALTEILIGGGQYSLTWEKIRESLDELTNNHLSIRYPMTTPWTIFRGRIDNKTELFDNISQLSNRNASDITDYGRCHSPNVSIFYGANNIETVLSELKPDIGDLVHIVRATPKINEQVILTVIGELDHVRRYDKGIIGDNVDIESLQEIVKNITDEDNFKKIFIDAFLSELFIKSANQKRDYKATSALSDILFSKQIATNQYEIDSLAYPSVAHRGGINFAIRCSSFVQKMQIDKCLTYKITDYVGYGIYGWHINAESKTIDNEGKINWK